MNVGALILAAGNATRMGQTKQLLPYKGRTLVEHAIQQAEQAGFTPIITVIGAAALQVRAAIERTSASWVVNESWQAGMGSSIAAGMAEMQTADAAAILLADQPNILAAHLVAMKYAFEKGGSPILAAAYAGTLGVPAFFQKSYFAALRRLALDTGARALLRNNPDVAGYDLPEATIDIDTPADFAALRLRSGGISEGNG